MGLGQYGIGDGGRSTASPVDSNLQILGVWDRGPSHGMAPCCPDVKSGFLWGGVLVKAKRLYAIFFSLGSAGLLSSNLCFVSASDSGYMTFSVYGTAERSLFSLCHPLSWLWSIVYDWWQMPSTSINCRGWGR